MNIQAGVLDRVETTFFLMKNNFIKMILPLFVLNFIFFGFLYLIFINYIVQIISWFDTWNYNDLFQVLYSPQWVLIVSILMFMWLLYAILYLPVLLTTIRIINKTFLKESVNLEENIYFWFKNILNSFTTYWLIFKYVYLIPAILFIIWGIWFNIWYLFEIEWNLWDVFNNISIGFMILWFILFIIFSIYRGLKVTFAIHSAVSQEEFTQNNFNLSKQITDLNLLRILWNFVLVWFIVWFASWFIEGIFEIFISNPVTVLWLEELILSLENSQWNINISEVIKNSNIDISFSNINYVISTFVTQFIWVMWAVFMLVFTFVFMKRLEIESKQNTSSEIINETETISNTMDRIKKEL